MNHQRPGRIVAQIVADDLQLGFTADKEIRAAPLTAKTRMIVLLDLQFPRGAFRGVLRRVVPIRLDLLENDLRHPAFHIPAKLGQVIGGEVGVAAARGHEPGGTGFKSIFLAQPLPQRLFQPFLLCGKRRIHVPGKVHVYEIPDLSRLGKLAGIVNLPEAGQHMLPGIRNAQRALPDFLLRGGSLETDDGRRRILRRLSLVKTTPQLLRRHGAIDDLPQDSLDFAPRGIPRVVLRVREALPPGLQDMDGRNRILVLAIPFSQNGNWRIAGPGGKLSGGALQGLKFSHRDLFRQGPPSVAVAQQDQEIGSWRNLLRAPQLVDTNPHRAVIETRFARHAPAEVNGLELKTVPNAKLLQLGEDMLLQRIALRFHVAECRTDKKPDDGPSALCGLLNRRRHHRRLRTELGGSPSGQGGEGSLLSLTAQPIARMLRRTLPAG